MLSLTHELLRVDAEFRDAATLKRESCKVTEAGPVWPVPRAEMRHPGLIKQRMYEDLAAIAAERVFVELYDLADFGWPQGVVETLGLSAVNAFRFSEPASVL